MQYGSWYWFRNYNHLQLLKIKSLPKYTTISQEVTKSCHPCSHSTQHIMCQHNESGISNWPVAKVSCYMNIMFIWCKQSYPLSSLSHGCLFCGGRLVLNWNVKRRQFCELWTTVYMWNHMHSSKLGLTMIISNLFLLTDFTKIIFNILFYIWQVFHKLNVLQIR